MTASRIACCTSASVAEITQQKRDLRRNLLAVRRSISIDARADNDKAIRDALLTWCEATPIRCLGVYWPIRGEPDLRDAYAALSAQGIALALPVTVEKNAPLRFAAWKPGDATVRDAMGIAIPEKSAPFLEPDALVIPCVGFNSARVRLGYGGGFYDRTLASAPRPRTVGIAYALGLTQFEAEPHDIALDVILTECGDPTATVAQATATG